MTSSLSLTAMTLQQFPDWNTALMVLVAGFAMIGIVRFAIPKEAQAELKAGKSIRLR